MNAKKLPATALHQCDTRTPEGRQPNAVVMSLLYEEV